MAQADLNSQLRTTNPLEKLPGIFCLRSVLLLLFLVAAPVIRSQPSAKVKDPKKNFGFVKRGDIIRNEYIVTNVGTAPLIFTNADIPCSCTTAEFSKQPILPQQTTTVTLVFNTATVYGRQDRTVLLHSNDPKAPLKLRYKGVVMEKK